MSRGKCGREVCGLFFFALVLIFSGGWSLKADAASNDSMDMYRLYNKNSGEHFYTASEAERNNLASIGWKYEGIGWVAPKTGEPVFRMYNAGAGDHHYTTSSAEKDNLVKVGWKYEGIGWYSSTGKEMPLYRAYNSNAKAGSHNYTVNGAEQSMLLKSGWRDEGIAWYGVGGSSPASGDVINGSTEVNNTLSADTANYLRTQIFNKVNSLRAEKGVPAMGGDGKIQQAANIRASEIQKSYRSDHSRPDGRKWSTVFPEIGYDTTNSVIGENICSVYLKGRDKDALVSAMFEGWKKSPTHYEHMVDGRFKTSSIGIVIDEAKGYAYGVQLFSSK